MGPRLNALAEKVDRHSELLREIHERLEELKTLEAQIQAEIASYKKDSKEMIEFFEKAKKLVGEE